MQADEINPQATEAEEDRPEKVRPRSAKIAAIAVAGLLAVMGSSFAASLAFASVMGGDHGGPPGGDSASVPSDCSGAPSFGS